MITPQDDIIDYLKIYYMYLDINQIKSVFGNAVYPSRFYGGRTYRLEHSLTDVHINTLYEQGKGVTFTLTNHYFSEEVYQANRYFLEKHHRPGNAIVCTNDEFARRLRADFPDYTLKASLIKHLNTVEKVTKALDIYDRVVIPMDKNDDDDFLNQLPEKSRIVLFANANCAYNCTARTCYAAISQVFWGLEKKSKCSKDWLPRPYLGHSFFDVEKFGRMGFHHFKLVPDQTKDSRGALNALSRRRPATGVQSPAENGKKLFLYSFPKCGRTWLRFLLANYFNLLFKLNVLVDLQTLFTLLPNDHSGFKGIDSFQFHHIPGLPLILSSHTPCKKDGVLLLRSIPDVVVSDYFQLTELGKVNGSMSEFISSSRGSLYRYCDYLNTCSQKDEPKPLLTMTYEGLHQDTAGELKKLFNILDLPIHDDYINQAVELARFDNMQEVEKESGLPSVARIKESRKLNRVRQGRVGGYVDYLQKNEIETLLTTANELLTTRAKDLLEEHGIGMQMPEIETSLHV